MKERKAFFQAVLPSMLAFALSGVYAIVDGFFLGHAMGDHALAAVKYGLSHHRLFAGGG